MIQARVSALEDHLGYWLRCLSNYVHHSFAGRLEVYGVSVAQWVVLRVLYDLEEAGSLTLNEAAERVGVDKSTLSRMVDRLEQKGLASRDGADGDRRFVRLALTPEGRRLVPILAREADGNDQDFFRTLTDAQRREMGLAVERLLKANGWEPSARGRDRME